MATDKFYALVQKPLEQNYFQKFLQGEDVQVGGPSEVMT